MCLSLPAIVIGPGAEGMWKVKSIRRASSLVTSLIESVEPGDYVTVFSGAIVGKLTKQDYDETVALWREMDKAMKNVGIQLVEKRTNGVRNKESKKRKW